MRSLNSLIRNIDAFTRYPTFSWDALRILWEMSLYYGKFIVIEEYQSSYGIQIPSNIKFDGFNVKCD